MEKSQQVQVGELKKDIGEIKTDVEDSSQKIQEVEQKMQELDSKMSDISSYNQKFQDYMILIECKATGLFKTQKSTRTTARTYT